MEDACPPLATIITRLFFARYARETRHGYGYGYGTRVGVGERHATRVGGKGGVPDEA